MIPGFFAAGARASGGGSVNEDNFNTDTTSLYTMTQDTGAPTASIFGGTLTITSPTGCQASFTRNGTAIADGYVEADIDTAQDSGLLLRFQDQNNFYLLAISDDSGSDPTQNLNLYRRVSGAFTSLAAVNLAWPRGSLRTIRLTVSGTSIKALVDGVELISVTDASISGVGKMGVRANGPPPSGTINNKFLALRWM